VSTWPGRLLYVRDVASLVENSFEGRTKSYLPLVEGRGTLITGLTRHPDGSQSDPVKVSASRRSLITRASGSVTSESVVFQLHEVDTLNL